MSSEIKSAKVVFLGSPGVGKSSLLARFLTNEFNENIPTTLGGAYFEKVHSYGEGQSIQFNFWDTAGQEKFKSLARVYYQQANAAILVYDVSDPTTFEGLKVWMEELKDKGPENMVIAFIGNKIDLLDHQVPYSEVQEYALAHGALLKLVSVKDNKGIDEVFDSIANQLEKPRESIRASGTKINQGKNDIGENKKCC